MMLHRKLKTILNNSFLVFPFSYLMMFTSVMQAQTDTCEGIHRYEIRFPNQSLKMASISIHQLHMLSLEMKSNPSCRVYIDGQGNRSMTDQQLGWDRVRLCIYYLTEKEGIPSGQIIFQYGGSYGPRNAVLIRCAYKNEEGPSITPPPFPHLRRSQRLNRLRNN